MISWLVTAWRAFVALLAFRQGESAGKADQSQADIVATNIKAQEITHAEAAAPVTRAAIIARLHDDPNA